MRVTKADLTAQLERAVSLADIRGHSNDALRGEINNPRENLISAVADADREREAATRLQKGWSEESRELRQRVNELSTRLTTLERGAIRLVGMLP